VGFIPETLYFPLFVTRRNSQSRASCNQKIATWYEAVGYRRPQVFENTGFARVFKNFGVLCVQRFERNLV
jgi:hypothetical protein